MNPEKMSSFAAWLSAKKKQGKRLQKDQLLILILFGILLLVIALPTGKTKRNTGVKEPVAVAEKSKEVSDTTQPEEMTRSYTEKMEEKLEQILASMEHVGRVKVVLTLQASGEKVVEKDIPVVRSSTEEQDSQGGSRSISSVDSGETTIYETEAGKSTPYVIQTKSPRVEGVLVVCDGAGVSGVSKNITDAIEVLFGIEPHKIKVVKMKTG